MNTSVLSATFAHAQRISPYLKAEVGIPHGADWFPAIAFARYLDLGVVAQRQRLRATGAAMLSSALLQAYQWPVVSTAIACYILDQRVPDLHLANTTMHLSADTEADAVALHHGRFTALPTDPAAGHPDVALVADQAALRTTLRTTIEAHLGPIIEQICDHVGGKARGLWLNVADSCTSTLIWLMQERDPTITLAEIEAEVAALIRVPGSPLNNQQIGLIQLTYQQQTEVFLQRATCCYWYRTEGGDYCSTCPKRTPESRHERLLNYMAEKQPKPLTTDYEVAA
jgi:ferric iron reductase protein FhuF